MNKKKKTQVVEQMQKQLKQKQGIADAIKIVQEFQKLQMNPKEDRHTNFSRFSKGSWESPRYFSQS